MAFTRKAALPDSDTGRFRSAAMERWPKLPTSATTSPIASGRGRLLMALITPLGCIWPYSVTADEKLTHLPK